MHRSPPRRMTPQIGAAGLLDYCASKHAAVGIDESLRFELRKLGKTGRLRYVLCVLCFT